MIDKINVHDVITFENNKEYMVAGKALYNNVNYLQLVGVEDFTIKFAAVTGNKAIILKNKEDRKLINALIPLFLESASKAMMKLTQIEKDD